MTNFLTVKEAAALVGKSSSSIRRIIYPIIESDDHPDRSLVWPGVDEVKELRMKGETFPWKLTEELLRREVPEPSKVESREPGRAGNADGELLSMLRGELEIKNRQIAQQAELISKQADLVSGLSERLREGNVLMAALQQKLALSDGRETTTVETSIAKPTATAKPEKVSNAPRKSAKAKRSFISRLFRS